MMCSKHCSLLMRILVTPSQDSIGIRRLLTKTWGFKAFWQPFTPTFSSSINAPTSSFDEEVGSSVPWIIHVLKRQSAWHLMFLSLWKDFRSRFDSIIESLRKQRDIVDLEAASIDIIEAKDARKKAQDDIQDKQKRELEAVERIEKSTKIAVPALGRLAFNR